MSIRSLSANRRFFALMIAAMSQLILGRCSENKTTADEPVAPASESVPTPAAEAPEAPIAPETTPTPAQKPKKKPKPKQMPKQMPKPVTPPADANSAP